MDTGTVIGAVQLVTPLIPSVISLVEQLITGGAQKKQVAVDLLHAGLTTLVNNPKAKMPSAGVADPALPAALGDAVQKAFDQISVDGKVPPIQPIPTPANGLKVGVAVAAGRTFLIVEM